MVGTLFKGSKVNCSHLRFPYFYLCSSAVHSQSSGQCFLSKGCTCPSAQNLSAAHYFIQCQSLDLQRVFQGSTKRCLIRIPDKFISSSCYILCSHFAVVTLTSLLFLECLGIDCLVSLAPAPLFWKVLLSRYWLD